MSGQGFGVGLAVLFLASVVASGEDWPRFRGPNGSGVSDSVKLPAEFGPEKNVLWKIGVPFARSSPVIGGDRIFLTAAEGEKLVILCLERSSGRITWRREIVRPRATPIYKANDPASPSSVTDGKNVYAFFPELGLVSFDSDGNERWRLPLGPFKTFYGLGASPILAGDTLILICDTRENAFLIAVDATGGKIRWRVERSEINFEGYTSPVIYDPGDRPAQVIVLGAHHLDAYALGNGDRLWRLRGLASFPVGSPVLGNGVVVVSTYGSDAPAGPTFDEMLKKSDASGDGRIARQEYADDEFGALDRNEDGFLDRDEWDLLRNSSVGDYGLLGVRLGGRGDVTQTAVAWRAKKTYPSVASSLIYKDVLYMVKTGGIIASMDPLTGEVFKVDRTREAMEEYYSSPVAADDKVILTSETGKVTVLKAGRQWEILAVNDLGEECYATPAIADGKIFMRTRHTLYCFGIK